MTDLAASPAELVRLSLTCLRSSQHLDDAWRGAEGVVAVPVGSAGDVETGPRLVGDLEVCVASAGTALGHLTSLLEIDADLVERIAFDLSGTDEAAAGAFAGLQTQVQP